MRFVPMKKNLIDRSDLYNEASACLSVAAKQFNEQVHTTEVTYHRSQRVLAGYAYIMVFHINKHFAYVNRGGSQDVLIARVHCMCTIVRVHCMCTYVCTYMYAHVHNYVLLYVHACTIYIIIYVMCQAGHGGYNMLFVHVVYTLLFQCKFMYNMFIDAFRLQLEVYSGGCCGTYCGGTVHVHIPLHKFRHGRIHSGML